MKIRLDWRKSAQENAAFYFQLAKELSKKIEGARRALEETKSEIEKEGKKAEEKIAPKMKRKKEEYEKYKWFFTSKGKLVLAGRDAKQNDILFSKMEENDLFFHADIQGAPAVLLKNGKGADEKEKKEAAQFAASHSSAWKVKVASVDVYCVEKKQLSKYAQGAFVGKGAFAITGKREWFKSTPLNLAVGKENDVVTCLPVVHQKAGALPIHIFPGKMKKGEAAKKIAKKIGADVNEVLLALPSGEFSVKERENV